MKCPSRTESTLVTSDRQGVEIDHGPQARHKRSWLSDIFD